MNKALSVLIVAASIAKWSLTAIGGSIMVSALWSMGSNRSDAGLDLILAGFVFACSIPAWGAEALFKRMANGKTEKTQTRNQ